MMKFDKRRPMKGNEIVILLEDVGEKRREEKREGKRRLMAFGTLGFVWWSFDCFHCFCPYLLFWCRSALSRRRGEMEVYFWDNRKEIC